MPQLLTSLGNNSWCLRGIKSIVEKPTDSSHVFEELRSPWRSKIILNIIIRRQGRWYGPSPIKKGGDGWCYGDTGGSCSWGHREAHLPLTIFSCNWTKFNNMAFLMLGHQWVGMSGAHEGTKSLGLWWEKKRWRDARDKLYHPHSWSVD